MMPRVAWCVLLVTLVGPLPVRSASAAKPGTPNIVLIYADDLGYGDAHCYNPQRGKIPTPNIDRLAREGMRFTDAHSSSGVCSPSRYTILTGRYHWRTRLQRGIVGVFGTPLIAPDRPTIGTLAQKKGYRTACIGKWHLGWDWPIPEDKRDLFVVPNKPGLQAGETHKQAWKEVFSQRIPGGPTTRGFDLYFGTSVPNWPPYCFIENDRTVGIPSEFLPERFFGHDPLLASRRGPAVPDWEMTPILPTLAERAKAFLRECTESNRPFLLYFPLTAPHEPIAVNDPWKGKSGLNAYADFVMETDAIIGTILDELDRLALTDDTLLIFTSDNGKAAYTGAAELEQMGHYSSGPLRGYKTSVYEGGHRLPFIVRWPGVVAPGTVCDQLVHQADVFATVREVLDVTVSEPAGEDSFSLVPLLRGEDRPIRPHAVSCAASGLPGMREGTWKFIPAKKPELYDLSRDIGETTNLADQEPERVAHMRALLEEIISRGRSTPGAPLPNDVPVRRFP
ncbi:sulfatase family protein [Thermostilla marina]